MTQIVNQENMPATYHFGLNALFDGYLTTLKFLCDGYVIDGNIKHIKTLIINAFLCDCNVIDRQILFDGYLIKVMK